MNDIEIAEIAMEFGDYDAKSQCYIFNGNGKFSILAFVASIIAATKEEDAKICDKVISGCVMSDTDLAIECRDAIRERKP